MLLRKTAEDRKADIITAVLGLADRLGPDRLTTNDVAQAVGVTQAAVFRHFPTKAELWTAVGTHIADRLEAAWNDALANGDTAEARLRALIEAQLRQIRDNPALPSILHSRELNVENAALRERFRSVLMQFQTHLVRNIDAMCHAKDPTSVIDPVDVAVLLTSLVQGIAIRWGLGARRFDIVHEGMRLFEVQLALITRTQVRI